MIRTLCTTAVACMTLAVVSAQAAPVTYTFTGMLDSTYSITTTGTLAGLFSAGDMFTLTSTVNHGTPDVVSNDGVVSRQYWLTGNEQTMSINSATYSVGDSLLGDDESLAEARTNRHDYIGSIGYDYTANHPNTPGGATTTLSNVDFIYLEWFLYDDDGLNDILDFADPRYPDTVDLADWTDAYVYFEVHDYDASGSQVGLARFFDVGQPVFDGVTAGGSGGSTGVPAPGPLALIGSGLLCLGTLRRKAA